MASSHLSPPPWLSSLQWKHRVLLLANPDRLVGDSRLRSDATDAIERHLLVLNLHSQQSPPALSHVIDLAAHMRTFAAHMMRLGHCAVLIGKDGTIKQKYSALPLADEVFQLIDAMPMRMEEMQQRNTQA